MSQKKKTPLGRRSFLKGAVSGAAAGTTALVGSQTVWRRLADRGRRYGIASHPLIAYELFRYEQGAFEPLAERQSQE